MSFSVAYIPFLDITKEHLALWNVALESCTLGTKTLYQTYTWARWLHRLLGDGRVGLYLVYDVKGVLYCGGFAAKYPLFWGYFWLYFPKGPLWFQGSLTHQDITCKMLFTELGTASGCVWVRTDIPLPRGAELFSQGLSVAHSAYHPKRTLCLDLNKQVEELLSEMTQKGRYNIRVALKKGIQLQCYHWENGIKICDIYEFEDQQYAITPLFAKRDVLELRDPIEIYYQMAQETSLRDGFSTHSQSYYRDFLSSFGEDAFLLIATDAEGEPCAGGIFVLADQECIYYYGASKHEKREFMAPYLVQWGAIVLAKEVREKKVYDFLGIGNPEDDKDPLHGVTQFKMKFGGYIQEYIGTYEYVARRSVFLVIQCLKWVRSFRKK